MTSEFVLLLLNAYFNSTNFVFVNIIRRFRESQLFSPFQLLLLFDQTKHYKLRLEKWIDQYLEYDFFKLFRMTQDTFNTLLEKIDSPELNVPNRGGGIPISAYTQLLMTLWWLGKGDTLISIGERFSVAEATVFVCTTRVLDHLLGLLIVYIVWPNENELISIEEEFRERSGYPGIIGAIDGCNIKVKVPLHQQDSYIDKNMNHTIKLQAITTAKKILTNISVGQPGSVHDIRVFRNSKIYTEIETNHNKRKYFPNDYHIVGDKAYPLLSWCMIPYKNFGNLTRLQLRHNRKLSRARITIENVFGMLKGRWRILKFINVNSIIKATKIIAVCCMLHNFCLINSDNWDEYEEPNEDYEDDVRDEDGFHDNNLEGRQKRNRICLNL